MEKAVHEQLTKYLEENKVFSKTQFGYRKGWSTELATLFLTDEISKEIDKEKWLVPYFSIYEKHLILLAILFLYHKWDHVD